MSLPSTSTTVLRDSIQRHNEVFESLLKLIPAQHYLARDAEEEEEVRVRSQSDHEDCLSSFIVRF